MELTNKPVEREVMLRRDGYAAVVKTFQDLLAVQFGWVKNQQGRVAFGVAERLEEPRRATDTRRNVLRCNQRSSLH